MSLKMGRFCMFHFEIRKNGTAFELPLLDSTVRWGEGAGGWGMFTGCYQRVDKWIHKTFWNWIEIFLLKVALYLSFSEIWSFFRQTDILTFPLLIQFLLQSVSVSLTRMGDWVMAIEFLSFTNFTLTMTVQSWIFYIRQYVSVLENHQYSTHKLCFINAEQEYKWLNSTIFWHLSSLSILYIEPIILFWNILLIGLCVIEHRT